MSAGTLRALGLVRGVAGAASLLTAALPGEQQQGRHAASPPGAAIAARVLAVRDVAQGVALCWAPTRASQRAGQAVDVLHGASMALLVAYSPRYRRAAAASAAAAVTWLALAELAGRS
jgi:hypothetical protein